MKQRPASLQKYYLKFLYLILLISQKPELRNRNRGGPRPEGWKVQLSFWKAIDPSDTRIVNTITGKMDTGKNVSNV